MEPIDDLTTNLTTLLENVAACRNHLDTQGQKLLLDKLWQLLKATEQLHKQVKALAEKSPRRRHHPSGLYLVKTDQGH